MAHLSCKAHKQQSFWIWSVFWVPFAKLPCFPGETEFSLELLLFFWVLVGFDFCLFVCLFMSFIQAGQISQSSDRSCPSIAFLLHFSGKGRWGVRETISLPETVRTFSAFFLFFFFPSWEAAMKKELDIEQMRWGFASSFCSLISCFSIFLLKYLRHKH